MEPTPRSLAWSAWAGWAELPRDLVDRRRLRLSVHELDARGVELRRDWARRSPHVAVYTPNQIRHLIRLESGLGRGATGAPERWRGADPDAYWRLHDFLQNVRLERTGYSEAGGQVPRAGGGGGAGAGRGAWEGAAWGWAAGAMMLAVLVLLVRALERYLHRRLFKGRRRRPSEEWPTASVRATSHQYGNDPGLSRPESDAFPPDGRESLDQPPPYYACAHPAPPPPLDPNKPPTEDPPPPYSACYFANPKDGVPTVHFSGRNVHSSENAQPNDHSIETQPNNRRPNNAKDVCEVNVNLEQTDVPNGDINEAANNATNKENNTGEAEIPVVIGEETLDRVVVESTSSRGDVTV